MIDVLIVGFGEIGKSYLRSVLEHDVNFRIVAREARETNLILSNGNTKLINIEKIESILPRTHFDIVIVATPITETYKVAIKVMELFLIRKLLIEKPISLIRNQIESIYLKALHHKIIVRVLLNRRYQPSISKIKNLLANNISSATLIFNENIEEVRNSSHPLSVKKKWLYANTIHVLDLFFYLIGMPVTINTKKVIFENHDKLLDNSFYYGNGVSNKSVSFEYQADWRQSGRWTIILRCQSNDIFLSPLEQIVYVDNLGNSVKEVFDSTNKAGFNEMINHEISILSEESNIVEYLELLKVVDKIGTHNE